MGLPVTMIPVLARLPADAQSMVKMDYGRRRKSKTFAYLAWFFLGWHYLYLRRMGLQFAFWLTGGGLLVWWVVDAFRVGSLVDRLNEDTARELVLQYGAIYSQNSQGTPPLVQTVLVQSSAKPLMMPQGNVFESSLPPTLPNTISLNGKNRLSSMEVSQSSYVEGHDDRTIRKKRVSWKLIAAIVAFTTIGLQIFHYQFPNYANFGNLDHITYTTKRDVNVRQGPTSNSTLVGTILFGETVAGSIKIGDNGKSQWLKITSSPYAGGYISMVNLKRT